MSSRPRTSSRTPPLARAIKKINFRGPIFGGFWRCGPKKFRETKLRLQLNKFTQKLDFDVLGEEERTRFRKRKNKKEKHQLIVVKSGLVGMKGYLKTYNNPLKYFFAVFKPFFNNTTFYTKLSRWFLGPKPKPRDSLPQNLAQAYNLLISNCC